MEDKKKIIDEGVALFIFQSKYDSLEILFEDSLPQRFKIKKEISYEVLKYRNIMIYLTAIEILSSLFGYSYYFIRRSFIYIIINIVTMVISVLGLYAIINMNEFLIIIYCVISTSLPGSFFFYQIIEFIGLSDTKYGIQGRLNDNWILLIFSLPYLYDLITGLFCIFFASKISKFNDLMRIFLVNENRLREDEEKLIEFNINEIKNKYTIDEIEKIRNLREKNNQLCIICLDKGREIMCYPCCHLTLCQGCMKSYEKQFICGSGSCPICRVKIEKFIRVRNV